MQSTAGRTIAGNYVSLLFIQAANILLPLLLLPYLVRTLGTEKYGLILLAQAFCTILYVFVEFGFNLSATRRISLAKDNAVKKAAIFSAVMGVKFILVIIVAIVYTAIIFIFPRFQLEWEVYALSYGVIIGQALFPDWFFQGIEKMQFIAILNVLAKVIFTALIFFFVISVQDYTLVPLYTSIGYIIAGFISFVISLKYVKIKKPSKVLMKELMIESKSIFVSNIAARLFNSANIFIVGIVAGDSIAGIYGSFEKIFIASKSFFGPLMQAIFPWLSKQDSIKQRSSIVRLAPIMVLLAAIYTVTVLLFGDVILDFLFNDSTINDYVLAFKILSIGTLFAAANMVMLSLYFPAVGDYITRMNILFFGGIFNVIFAFILVSFWPIYGIVIAVITTEFLLAVLTWFYFKKRKNIQVHGA